MYVESVYYNIAFNSEKNEIVDFFYNKEGKVKEQFKRFENQIEQLNKSNI